MTAQFRPQSIISFGDCFVPLNPKSSWNLTLFSANSRSEWKD